MNRLKLIAVVMCLMILAVNALVVPVSGRDGRGIPAIQKGMPEYYDPYASPECFEDLYFPRIYTQSKFNFTIPEYLRNKTVGHASVYLGSTGGDPRSVQIIFRNETGVMVTLEGAGGGSMNTMSLGNSPWIDVEFKMPGSKDFRLFEPTETLWEDIWDNKQHIEFTGAARTYNIMGFGGATNMDDFGWPIYDWETQFVRLHIESDKPLRYYIFDSMLPVSFYDSGSLLDYQETPTTNTYLDARDDRNEGYSGDEFSLTVVNPGDPFETVNIEFTLEILDKPTNNNTTYIVLALIFVAFTCGAIWIYRKRNY